MYIIPYLIPYIYTLTYVVPHMEYLILYIYYIFSNMTTNQGFRQNILLYMNTVDFLAKDEALVAIRTKGQTQQPIENLDEQKQLAITYGNIIGLPFALICIGMFRWRFVRNRRRNFATKFKKRENNA